MAIAGKIMLRPMGNYDSSKTYDILDMVRHDNNFYISKITNNIGNIPSGTDDDNWMFVVADGLVVESMLAGTAWTASELPSTQYWRSIAYGNGKFVAISESSKVAAYSTDGIVWTEATLPGSKYWYSITYGNGKFVAVAYGSTVATHSTDGITWTADTLPSQANWISVTYGGDKFVAIANNNTAAAYSSDGITWTGATLPSSQKWRSVTYGNGKFVAVAEDTNVLAYSANGVTWTGATLSSSKKWYSVAFGGDRFVAVAWDSNVCAHSVDGETWVNSELPSSQYWHAVVYGDDKFIAISYNSDRAAYSTDGVSWIPAVMPYSAGWNSAAYANGMFVAVAHNTDYAAYSIDSDLIMQGGKNITDDVGVILNIDEKIAAAIASIPTPDVSGPIGEHNTNTSAHEDIRTAINGKASTATYTVSIPTGWTANSSGGYYKTVTVSGVLAADNPIADVVLGSDVDANALYLEAWALVTRITTAANSIMLYANGDAPTTAFTIQLKTVR